MIVMSKTVHHLLNNLSGAAEIRFNVATHFN